MGCMIGAESVYKESKESEESGESFFKRCSKGCTRVVRSEQNPLNKESKESEESGESFL